MSSVRTYQIIIDETGKILSNNLPADFDVDNTDFKCSSNVIDIDNKKVLIRTYIVSDDDKENIDYYTDILNMRGFDSKLDKMLNRTDNITLVLFDIDNFKNFNDIYGHEIGNAVLRAVAQMFKHSVKDTDLVARYGGDEFIMAMADIDKETAKKRIELVTNRLRNGINLGDNLKKISITISCGIIKYDINLDKTQNKDKADGLLYEVKRNGKNNIMVEDDIKVKKLGEI